MKRTLLMMLVILIMLPVLVVAGDFWMLNVHGGVGYPLGEMLGEKTNMSWNAGLSARKGFDREISAGGSISYVNLPYKDTKATQPFSAIVINGELVYAPYLPDFFLWPYAKIGAGVFLVKYATGGEPPDYIPVPQEDTAFGLMFGGGVNYPLTNEIAANLEILYNQASVKGGEGDNYAFFTFNAGITIFIK